MMVDLPARIGPAEFSALGALVAVRCPHDLDALMQRAGGMWELGSRRWLIERQRLGPLIRDLRRTTDPLFRWAGLDLDEGGEATPQRAHEQKRELRSGVGRLMPKHSEITRQRISEGIRAALARKRAEVAKLGNSDSLRTGLPRAGETLRRRADEHAARVRPVIEEIRLAGPTTYQAVANALNERRVPTARGGKWHSTTVANLVRREGMGQPARLGAHALMRKADEFARNVLPVVRALQAQGIKTQRGLAQALNERGVPTALGGKWHSTTVGNVLRRVPSQ